MVQTDNQLEQCTLAAAAGAYDADEFALFDVQVNTVQYHQFTAGNLEGSADAVHQNLCFSLVRHIGPPYFSST